MLYKRPLFNYTKNIYHVPDFNKNHLNDRLPVLSRKISTFNIPGGGNNNNNNNNNIFIITLIVGFFMIFKNK
jgi:hypothetical protein